MDVIKANPKVFISYSQDSVDFADNVLTFSNRLRHNGIDTILDQYEESPLEGWPIWMENNIVTADYVIVICTKNYQQKILGLEEEVKGRGVKWEGNIIYQKLYSDNNANKKFLPVIFSKSDFDYIPTPIQGSTYYNISSDKGFDDLCCRIFGVNAVHKPPLGEFHSISINQNNDSRFSSRSITDVAKTSASKNREQSQYDSISVSSNKAENMFIANNVTITGGLNFGRK